MNVKRLLEVFQWLIIQIPPLKESKRNISIYTDQI